ncbi:MAG: hypothetical protein KC475_02045 [Cyanobacteria bacterium HKST-UBA03]|nr:hypothetical protein [Cyanobacteria bacterium HKST-UBA03]
MIIPMAADAYSFDDEDWHDCPIDHNDDDDTMSDAWVVVLGHDLDLLKRPGNRLVYDPMALVGEYSQRISACAEAYHWRYAAGADPA